MYKSHPAFAVTGELLTQMWSKCSQPQKTAACTESARSLGCALIYLMRTFMVPLWLNCWLMQVMLIIFLLWKKSAVFLSSHVSVKNIKSWLWEEIKLLIKNDLLLKDLTLSTACLRLARVELDAVFLQGIWIRFLSLCSLHPWTSGWDGFPYTDEQHTALKQKQVLQMLVLWR